jgi:hypothetical protein
VENFETVMILEAPEIGLEALPLLGAREHAAYYGDGRISMRAALI